MKKLFYLSIITAVLLLTGCKDESSNLEPSDNSLEDGKISFTYDGTSYSGKPFLALIGGDQTIAFTINPNESGVFNLAIDTEDDAVGIYTLDKSSSNSNFSNIDGNETSFFSNDVKTSVIEITEHDKVNRIISGTFNIQYTSSNGETTVEITNGVFEKLEYTSPF